MTKIILSGADGAMGRVLTEQIEKAADLYISAGIDQNAHSGSFPVYDHPSELTEEADVIIDFSHFSAFDKILDFALSRRLPLVMATTGLSEENEASLREASRIIPIFRSANMSLGINLLVQALKQIAPSLFPAFDIEIHERHHNKKKDAPSGTALLLADAINDSLGNTLHYNTARDGRNAERTEMEIGISAARGGTIPGEHTVLFAGEDELIELKHTALSKKIFANGALKASRWLIGQEPGLYDMQDLLQEA